MTEIAIARFWKKVDRRGPDDCWPWLGHVDPGGYGSFWWSSRVGRAHCFAYIALIGPIPLGPNGKPLKVDHLCHVAGECLLTRRDCPHRSCMNPAHLEAKTQRENVLRGNGIAARHAAKTSCQKCGGPYTIEKLGRGKVGRRCAPCKAARSAARYRRQVSARLRAAEQATRESPC